MRFIRFFLIISIFMQPLCSAEQEVVQQGLFDRAKASVAKAALLGKQTVSFIFSDTTESQWWFLAPEIFISKLGSLILDCHGLYLNATTSAIPFNELSPAIQDALHGMNVQDIAVKLYDGRGGFALWNTIFIGKKVLESSDTVQSFLVGHEISHIQNNHLIKNLALDIAMIACCIGINKMVLPKLEQALETTEKDSYTYKCLMLVKNILSFFDRNPLITYIFIQTVSARFSQYCEKQADMIAAATLNSAQGGIDYFNQEIIMKQIEQNKIKINDEESEGLIISLLERYLSAWLWVSRKLSWSSHPSLETRIDYLLPLAQQKAATII